MKSPDMQELRINMKNNLRVALIWFAVTLAVYALILWLLPNVQAWAISYGYHFVLLAFPLALLFVKWESVQSLGLVKGRWKFGLIASLATIAVIFVVYWLQNQQIVIPTLSHQLVSGISWAAVAEEISLRGYIQPKLETRIGKWPGLLITALLFSILHLPKIFISQLADPTLLIDAFILGIVFGFIRNKTNSIYYSILCHVCGNLIIFFLAGS